MLSILRISNFALIDFLELELKQGFSVLTGETGSGKSILLNALNLILGERADYSVIGPSSSKTFVEAEFIIQDDFKAFFEENDLDFLTSTVVRREINTQGKSRAFINDTPISLSVLKLFTTQLIRIHSQYNSLELKEKSYQLDILDCLADIENERAEYSKLYETWKSNNTYLLELQKDYSDQVKLMDFNQFQLSELLELELDRIDYKQIELELKELENVESLKGSYYSISEFLGSENGINVRLNTLKLSLERSKIDSVKLNELIDRIGVLLPELKDINDDAERFADDLEMNPDKVIELTEKLDNFNRLLTKHNKVDQQELMSLINELSNQVDSTSELQFRIQELEQAVTQEYDEVLIRAGILHSKRLEAVGGISKQIQNLLIELKMPDTLLLFQLYKSQHLSNVGHTEIELLFSANKGIAPISIEKAISGGELSRVMLSLQKLISEKKQLPTIIFDEIDTGVSGEVAHKMSSMLNSMSNNTQLLAITHLPQVAARANYHAKVEKYDSNNRTISRVSWLSENERVVEIARLMSGEIITDSAIANARNLILN
jgi:DNA repair protein RecN (Recombination protein N)